LEMSGDDNGFVDSTVMLMISSLNGRSS
jgi:hypothetical protein